MSDFPKRVERLDNFLLVIVVISLTVPEIAKSYGLDEKLMWFPIIFYTVWIIYKAYKSTNPDCRERAIIEKMRAWSYLFSLGVTFIVNYLMMYILPRTFTVFIVGVTIASSILVVIVKFLPENLFRREIISMNDSQLKEIRGILIETGSASIFFSISILILNLLSSPESSILNIILDIIPSFILFGIGLLRERKSSNLARELSISLINSGWYRKYSQGLNP